MKTKLIALTWRGSASVDPRFSAAMLPWTINDIRERELYKKLSIGIENGLLETYNSDFEIQFSHFLKYIVGMCRIIPRNNRTVFTTSKSNNAINSISYGTIKSDDNIMEFNGPTFGMIYLLKDPRDPLLHVHLYECDFLEEMTELMHQMRDPVHTLGGSVGSIPHTFVSGSGNNGTTSNSDSNLQKTLKNQGPHSTPASNLKFSEAMRTAHTDSSPNPISSKITASKSYTQGLNHSAGTVNVTQSNSSGNLALLGDISPNNSHFFEVMYVGKIRVSHKRVPFTFIDDALPKFKAYDAQRTKFLQTNDLIRRGSITSENGSTENVTKQLNGCGGGGSETDESLSDNASSVGKESDIGGRKLKIVEEHVVADDCGGEKNEKHEKNNKNPRKKLVRGNSQTLLPLKKDIPIERNRSASIGAIPQVEQNRTMVFLVGRSEVRLISPDRKQVLLCKEFKDIASVAQGHQNADHFGIICRETNSEGYIGYVFKCQSDHVTDDIVAAISQAFVTCSEQKNKEKSQIFSCEHCPMLWYHKLCGDVEGLSDKKTQAMIFRRIENLTDDEQDIIWAKFYGAEKINNHSLGEQNQFLMMLLRAHCESRQQRHVHDTAENRSEFLNQYLGGSTIFMKAKRSLTSSFDHLLKRKGSKDDFSNTIRDMQMKDPHSEGSGGEGSNESSRQRLNVIGSNTNNNNRPNAEQLKSPMMDIFMKVGNSPKESENHPSSWRQAILHRVVTPSKNLDQMHDASELLSPMRIKQSKQGKRSKEDLRTLWKTAIRQIILLARMEKENARLMASQSENELKKIKLDYDEILPCDKQAVERWELIIERDSLKIDNKKDPKVLLQAIKNGVPRAKRGEVWSFLAEQFSMHTAPIDAKKFPNFNTPYQVLLKNLTEHQHAIFIDLGRTFPNHKYYKAALGIGQLSLFNLLKAYSILDPELGYCQGLGFICGVLLLHCDEAEAFELLKHLMFRRQMRTKYLPDMKKLQLQLYQMSRLVKDHLPDLYDWLDYNDVSPTLYGAPWILTVFSSQFPLGFVARVFDLLFLESSEVIFKFSIALLTIHKDELLARDNFEDVMDYLKNKIPKIDSGDLEKITKSVFSMDIRKQLSEYQVEYNVLQEEICTTNKHLESLKKEKQHSEHLENQLQFAQSSIAQLEKTRTSQQSQIASLQIQVQTLEVTVQTLGRFIASTVEQNSEVDLPGDIRRIVQQVDEIEKQRRKPIFVERKIGKSVSMNSQLGFPLKVLEEINEKESDSPLPVKKKSPFFENTYEQLRKANQRPNRLAVDLHCPTSLQISIDVPKSPKSQRRQELGTISNQLIQPKETNSLQIVKSPMDHDSGVGTPLSPIQQQQSYSVLSPVLTPPSCDENAPKNIDNGEMHPLSMCGDVNFRYNGTTQLKTFKPIHPRINSRTSSTESDSGNLINQSIRS